MGLWVWAAEMAQEIEQAARLPRRSLDFEVVLVGQGAILLLLGREKLQSVKGATPFDFVLRPGRLASCLGGVAPVLQLPL